VQSHVFQKDFSSIFIILEIFRVTFLSITKRFCFELWRWNMVDRNFYLKKFGKIFWTQCKKLSHENSLSLLRNYLKAEMILVSYDVNDQWPRLLQIKSCLISYGFSRYRSYTDFTLSLSRFWFGVNMVIDVVTEWNHFDFLFGFIDF